MSKVLMFQANRLRCSSSKIKCPPIPISTLPNANLLAKWPTCPPGLGQVWMDQVGLVQVGLGQVRLGQVRLGQVGLGWVRSAQVGLDQVRLSQVGMFSVQQCCFSVIFDPLILRTDDQAHNTIHSALLKAKKTT